MQNKSLLQTAGIGIVVGAIAVAIAFFIADAVSGPLRAEGADGALADVPIANAIGLTIVGGLLGTLVAYLLRNRSNGGTIFLALAVVFLVAYGMFSLSAAENTTTGIWLNVMHLAAAIPILGSLIPWMRRQAVEAPSAVATV